MLEKLKGLFSKSSESHRPELMEDVAQGSARIERKTYTLKRWSRRTFVASPCDPHFSDGDEVSIDVSVRLGGETLEFSGLAMIVKVNPVADEIECRFLDIDRAAQPAIDRHFDTVETGGPSSGTQVSTGADR